MNLLNWKTPDQEKFYPSKSKILDVLNSASYKIEYDDMVGVYFELMPEKTDSLTLLEDSVAIEIIDVIKAFLASKETFNLYDYIWKRGILLYGPPGSGKTSTINLIKQHFIKENGIVFYSHRYFQHTIDALHEFRKREPERPILLIMEDIEEIIHSYDNNSRLLSFLEGEDQTENIVVLATTNNINKIPDNVKCRPGRFDIVKFVGVPSNMARKAYILSKFPQLKENSELNKILNDTEGFYFSHLKELIISVFCLNANYNETLQRLKDLIVKDAKNYMKTESSDDAEVSEKLVVSEVAPRRHNKK